MTSFPVLHQLWRLFPWWKGQHLSIWNSVYKRCLNPALSITHTAFLFLCLRDSELIQMDATVHSSEVFLFLFLYNTRRHSFFLRNETERLPAQKTALINWTRFLGKMQGALCSVSNAALGFSCSQDHKLFCFTTPPRWDSWFLYLAPLYFLCRDANSAVWLLCPFSSAIIKYSLFELLQMHCVPN